MFRQYSVNLFDAINIIHFKGPTTFTLDTSYVRPLSFGFLYNSWMTTDSRNSWPCTQSNIVVVKENQNVHLSTFDEKKIDEFTSHCVLTLQRYLAVLDQQKPQMFLHFPAPCIV
jgi:hypothetical protein